MASLKPNFWARPEYATRLQSCEEQTGLTTCGMVPVGLIKQVGLFRRARHQWLHHEAAIQGRSGHASPPAHISSSRSPPHRLHDELIRRLGRGCVRPTCPDCARSVVIANQLHFCGVVPVDKAVDCIRIFILLQQGRPWSWQHPALQWADQHARARRGSARQSTHSTTLLSPCMMSCTAPSVENRGVSCIGRHRHAVFRLNAGV